MRIRILGAAAGGGLPQWNCCCPNCEAVRAGSPHVRARTQSSIAISSDDDSWFLLNVAADIRQQILNFRDLGPGFGALRGTKITGCLLTDAEIDHASGLLQLREGCTMSIFSTRIVHRWLTSYLPIGTVLSLFADRSWNEMPLESTLELPLANGDSSQLSVRLFETGRDRPRYVTHDTEDPVGSQIGLSIRDARSGGVLVYAPGVSEINDALITETAEANCVLMDGTFWTEQEPIQMGITDRTASQMGHIPVSGRQGSLAWLGNLAARERVYVHINNTNPMLNEQGSQCAQVQETGVRIGADGDEFRI